MKQTIVINDLDMLIESLTHVNKIVDKCKLVVSDKGLSIYTQNTFARAELFTDAITSQEQVEFCLDNISTLIKILNTVQSENAESLNTIKLEYDKPFILITSKKVKTKLSTVKQEIVQNNISEKIQTILTPVFQFVTNSQTISQIDYHSFIFKDTDQARIYLEANPELEKNCIYARIDNKNCTYSNAITLNLGRVILGRLDDTIEYVLDFNRLNIFNLVKSNEITISLMNKHVLFSEINTIKNDHYINLKIYCSFRKN